MATLELPEKLEEDALRAQALVERHGRALVIGHYDADGISSAATVCAALKKLDVEFTARNIQVVTPQAMKEHLELAEGVVFLTDLASSMCSMLATMRTPEREIVVVDHHPPDARPPEVVLINAHVYGINGTFHACSSTMAYAMALAWDSHNTPLFRQAIPGAIGDKQATPPKDFNRMLVDHAVSRKVVELREELPLGPGPLKEEIAGSHDPYFRRLPTPEKAAAFLSEAGLDPDSSFSSLDGSRRRLLSSLLIIELVESGAHRESLAKALRTRYLFPDGEYGDVLSSLIDSSGRMGDTGTGLATALGSRAARRRAEEHAAKFRERLLALVRKVDEGTRSKAESGLRDRASFQWFLSDEPALVGTVAEVCVGFVGRPDRPVLGFAPTPKGEVMKGSARSSRALVERGLDLGAACDEACRAVGGHGGGHSIAAGITVPVAKLEEFLTRVDSIIGAQLRLAPEGIPAATRK